MFSYPLYFGDLGDLFSKLPKVYTEPHGPIFNSEKIFNSRIFAKNFQNIIFANNYLFEEIII